jgi:serine/threonine protein kinase
MSDPSKRIGDYEIISILGAGGMGRVYKVKNVLTDRTEAMKVLLPDLEGHEEVAARFLREIKVLAGLDHPHIAALRTALTIDNQLVMIMEYVEGQSVSSALDKGPLSVADALTYLDQVLDALSYAHKHKIIHRDIKPANMMVTSQGYIKLMDFGIARTEDESSKLTAPGSTLGSMSYMSPEQIKGEATDERSDLYSLGISLYEMITGEKPFHGDSNFSIMAAHINQAPRPPIELHPGLPKAVNDVILMAIAKVPEQRFQTADAFRNAIKQTLRSVLEERTVMQGSNDRDERTVMQGSQDRTVAATSAATTKPVTVPIASRIDSALRQPPAPTSNPTTPPPAAGSSNRGLYMGLGALVLLIVIAAAGFYLPKFKQASASEASPAATAPKTEATAPASQPVAAPVSGPAQPATSAEQPVAEPPAASPATSPATKATHAVTKNALTKAAPPAATAAAATPAIDTAALNEVETTVDQLTTRAASVDTGLANLQRQQAAAGYGLRGDMAEKQAAMRLNISKAQDAVRNKDVERAKKYAGVAETNIEALEKFLGR